MPRIQQCPIQPKLKDIVKAGSPDEVAHAYTQYGYRLSEIAEHIGLHYTAISRHLAKYKAM